VTAVFSAQLAQTYWFILLCAVASTNKWTAHLTARRACWARSKVTVQGTGLIRLAVQNSW